MVIAFLNIACPLLMAPLFWESAIGVEAKIVGFGLQTSGAILSAIAFAKILRQKRLSNG